VGFVMTDREKIIEAMARGMCSCEGTSQCAAICLSRFASSNQKGQCSDAVRAWGRKATAALAAIEAMGAVVVPVEPTDRMIDATNDEYGWSADGIYGHYAAMLSASPYAKEPT
jgi:hypothetical protein